MAKKVNCKLYILPAIGVTLVFSAIVSYYYAQYQIKLNVHKNVIIAPGSNAYRFWMDPPAAILRKIYLYEVVNSIEVQNGSAKPLLVQRGPYTYREIWSKKNVEFLGDDLVRFIPITTLVFVPELSAGSEQDEITFLNIPAVSFIEVGSKLKVPDMDGLINVMLKLFKSDLFVRKTVRDLVSGYDDPLMTLAATFFPNTVKGKQFSLLNGENGTSWQNYTIMTGYDDAANVGRILSWDGAETLNFWGDQYANMINGTDGTFFPPFRTKDETVYAFSSDMCRSYHLEFLKENKIKNLHVYDYHLPENIFSNSSVNPANIGFCKDDCLGNGVLNISTCYGGVSGFISQPHFLNADQKFLDAVDGLKPNKDIHDFVLHFEPTTGVPVAGNIRLQINFYVPHNDKIDAVKHINPVLLPVMFFDDSVELDDPTQNQLATVAFYVRLINIIVISLLSIGFLISISSTGLIFYRFYKLRQEKKQLLINGVGPNETTSLLASD